MSSARLRVGIVGGSGYGGSELLRLCLGHPRLAVGTVTARRAAGRPVAEVHPTLRGHTGLVFGDDDPDAVARAHDVVFVALPNEDAGPAVEAVRRAGARCIDLSGAYRLRDTETHARAYGFPPPAPDLRGAFVYGLTEWARPRLRDAAAVANPGCFATAAILALLPLAEAGLLAGDVIVNGATGSSGAGADARPTTHHPVRAQAYFGYKPLAHQHEPEIVQALADAGAGPFRLDFVPHSAPFVRGIFATAYVRLAEPDAARAPALYAERYAAEPFVRVVPGSPDVNVVAGSNHADLALVVHGPRVVIFCALDNLVKGAAGQAVQNLNVMQGWPETLGLEFPGIYP